MRSLKTLTISVLLTPALIFGFIGYANAQSQAGPIQDGQGAYSSTGVPAFDKLVRETSGLGDLIETLEAKGGFDTLLALLDQTGLTGALQGSGPLTLFAPDDNAFGRLPANTVRLLTDPRNEDLLVQVLTFHVAPGEFPASDLIGRSSVASLNGQDLELTLKRSGFFVEKSQVVETDIPASNGIIHVINAPMIPNLADVPGSVGGVGTIRDQLAGTAAATRTINKISGGDLFGSDGPGRKSGEAPSFDIGGETGDDSSLPFYQDGSGRKTVDAPSFDQSAESTDRLPDIVDTAIAAGAFKTLVSLVQIAGLEDALRSAGPFTVLAPTDAAFSKIDGAVLRDLVENRDNGVLASILLYHVIPGSFDSAAVAGLTQAPTLFGRPVSIQARDATNIQLNGSSKVILPDVLASNGIIHVIDEVLFY
jgi:uncharacterized surface protein with fasciclin (FAS1) repeats